MSKAAALSMASLEHPLPAGMRDLLPEEAAARRAVARAFLGHAELFGYEQVIPPVFEYAHTIERGLGTLDPREIVRFVEPETGEVVALRPDVTPQIARLVATRLPHMTPPYRLAYDASVLRRRVGSRARTHRQIAQLGVELLGVRFLEGDTELLVLAARALSAMGLPSFQIDLGHADVFKSLVAGLEPARAEALAVALGHKDRAEVARLAGELPIAAALAALCDLHGAPALLESLPAALLSSPAAPAIAELRQLVSQLGKELEGVPGVTLTVDLGEVRGLAYYTGPFYQVLAEGPGVPVGAGGRYDQLLERFDCPLPASGLALDVDALLWALRAAKSPLLVRPRRVVVHGVGAASLARALRSAHVPVAVLGGDAADAARYAADWSYALVVDARVHEVSFEDRAGSRTSVPTAGACAAIVSRLGSEERS